MRARGLDISRFQYIPNYRIIPSVYSFIIIQADETFNTHYKGLRDTDRLLGSYKFCDCSGDAVQQAAAYWNACKDKTLELGPFLDIENVPPRGNELAWMRVMHAEVTNRFGRPPMWYTYPSWITETLVPQLAKDPTGDAFLSSLTWWPADYSAGVIPSDSAKPRITTSPKLTYWDKWLFWQTSGDGAKLAGAVPGINGGNVAVDQDCFNGDLSQLQVFAKTGLVGGTGDEGGGLSFLSKAALALGLGAAGYAAYKRIRT